MMTNKELMYKFILYIYDNGMITEFLKNIFNYPNLTEINYIFRVSESENSVIIDIFDNISENRFNRYYFDFKKGKVPLAIDESANVFVTRINVLSVTRNINLGNNLLKLAYLFKIGHTRRINYARTFLTDEFVEILIHFMEDAI